MGGGDSVHFIAGDVMKKDDIEALVDGTNERYGSVDILVNNAGGIDRPRDDRTTWTTGRGSARSSGT